MNMNTTIARIATPVGVIGVLFLLFIPISPGFLDVLIALNITASILMLLTVMSIKRPLDFSVFPSVVLIMTLFRLGLNVASTRLVLSEAYAGEVINAFGHFVISGSIVIGLVVFMILVVIQFAVVTNGAGRAAEVGARFTLDALPGKQMAIDADLSAGLIDEKQALKRRAEVAAEADFYGAMDGGSRFVKGDAIAGIIITLINLIGGFAIGMLQRGMTASEALDTYSLLTVGDGLVTQIPALLMSVATGLVVTRSGIGEDLGSATERQVVQSSRALVLSGGAAIVIAFVPAIPKLPFIIVGVILLILGNRTKARDDAKKAAQEKARIAPAAPGKESPESLADRMHVHPLEILLAPDMVDMVGQGVDQDLLGRVQALRRKTALDLGLILPPVRTRDSVDLPQGTYVIQVHGVEVARGEAPSGRCLALGEGLDSLPGVTINEPVFGLPGRWIPRELSHNAQMAGATVVDRVSVLVTHLSSIITKYAGQLLTREDVRLRNESLKETSPSLVEELVPTTLTLGEIQRVLQGLLKEQVPIRDLERIYEALSHQTRMTTDTESLIEACRLGLGDAIVARYSSEGTLNVLTIEPATEQILIDSLRPTEQGTQLSITPEIMEELMVSVQQGAAAVDAAGTTAVVVCAPRIRAALQKLVSMAAPRLPVLSYSEVAAASIRIETVGRIFVNQSVASTG